MCNVYAYLLSSSSALLKGKSKGKGKDKDTADRTSNENHNDDNTNNVNNNDDNNNNDNNKDDPVNDPASYYLSEGAYASAHARLLALEGRVLSALGFDTHVALPHGLAVTYLQALDFFDRPREAIAGRAVAHLNAALLSPQLLYLTHQPHALAVAAAYAAARDAAAKMPECPWWEVFDVDREELGFLVVAMRSVEPWVRKLNEDFGGVLGAGTVTREWVEAEMRKRGLRIGNGNGTAGKQHQELSEEEAMLRRMDATTVPMEE